MIFLLHCFYGDPVIANLLSMGFEGLPGHSSVLLYRISLDDGKCGPVGCAVMLSRRSLSDCLAAWDVDNAVIMVCILHAL